MDQTTLFTILWVENLLIVAFILVYVGQYRTTAPGLYRYALARFLQGSFWFLRALDPDSPLLQSVGSAALTLGIALESYCLVGVLPRPPRHAPNVLGALAGVSLLVDGLARTRPHLVALTGNLATASCLLYVWWHLTLGRERTTLQRATGWVVFSRGALIFLGGLLLDVWLADRRAELYLYLNTGVAALTVFFPLLYLFLLKEKDDLSLRESQSLILRKNAELTELNATKDKFFSIISHDLRGPLASLLTLLDLTEEDLARRDYARLSDNLRLARQVSHQYFALLNNLLQWSRSQSGRLEFRPEPVELPDLARSLSALTEAPARAKEIALLWDLPSALTVRADRFMLETVLRNLISNALKFTPRGGQVLVSAAPQPHGVRFEVRDSGVGIPPERQARLFRIESNSSTPGTERETGTGLGLILCREFVERHGGSIGVSSEPGQGSRFHFLLP